MASLGAALKKRSRSNTSSRTRSSRSSRSRRSNDRRLLLFYESAEGGAGVLRRLASEPDGVARLARTALEVCHFDPNTGEDRRQGTGRTRGLRGGLLRLPDELRQPARPPRARPLRRPGLLLSLARIGGRAVAGRARPRGASRTAPQPRWLRAREGVARLASRRSASRCRATGSTDRVVRGAAGLRLRRIQRAAIFIDGPVHDQDDVAGRRPAKRACLEELGYLVHPVRLRHASVGADLRPVSEHLREGRMTFAVGSLVKARGREWVVLPESSRRPARRSPPRRQRRGGHRPLPAARVRQRGALRPARSGQGSRRLPIGAAPPRRAAARRFASGRAVPLVRAHRRGATALPARPAPHGPAAGPGPPAHRRRRGHRQDDRGAARRARAARPRRDAQRLAVLCPPHLAGQWQAEMRDKFHLDAELVAGLDRRPARAEQASASTSRCSTGSTRHDRLDGLHQERPPTRRVPPRRAGARDRR